MAQDPARQSLPFITRDMLAFESGTAFQLAVVVQASRADVLLIRGATREGPFSFRIDTIDSGIPATIQFGIPDIPIWVTAIDLNGTFFQGELSVQVLLRINGDDYDQLCAGMVTATRSIAWPAAPAPTQRPGGGRVRAITGANPAAGAEVADNVPAGKVWRLIAVRVQLVAAAAAASRRVHLRIWDNVVPLLDAFSDIDQIISETKTYTFAAFGAIPDSTDNNQILVPIPANLILPEPYFIETNTLNLQAGDNFGAPVYWVEEFFDAT